ncbi:capsule assembly Wzi family protein [bacterium]|nr:capsule assembly Wzi family protein [bacterium]
MNKKIFLFLFLFPFLGFASETVITRNIPVSDPVYHDIDTLIAHGLVKKAIIGQRPWSEEQIRRMLKEAQENSEALCDKFEGAKRERCDRRKDYASELIDHLNERFRPSSKPFQFHPFDSLEVNVTFLDSPWRNVLATNGVGQIDARVNPLVANQNGKHYVDGAQYSLDLTSWGGDSRYLILDSKIGIESLFPRNSINDDFNLIPTRLYLKSGYKNFSVTIGRDEVIWGQGENGGLLLSKNARPLDMMMLTADHPFYFPWVFKYLGLFKPSLFVANLGSEDFADQPFFTGLKFTLKPASFFELGISQALIMGGKNGPEISPGEVFGEFFASRGGFLSTSGIQNENLSNRIYGFDGRINFPSSLRGASLYFEMMSDDAFFSRFKTNWSYLGGLYIPRIDNKGKLSARAEFRYMAPIFYRHGVFVSGYTLNKQILGDELGSDAYSVSGKLYYHPCDKTRLRASLYYQNRDNNLWLKTPSSEFVVTLDTAAEKRIGTRLDGDFKVSKKIALNTGLGYEHVSNFNSTSVSRHNFLLSSGLKISFGK